jgi:hypothetical protein
MHSSLKLTDVGCTDAVTADAVITDVDTSNIIITDYTTTDPDAVTTPV